MSIHISGNAEHRREQSRGSDGRFGQQPFTPSSIDLDEGASEDPLLAPPGFEERYREMLQESNRLYAEYEQVSVACNEMAIQKVSRLAARAAPEEAIAVGIAAEEDDEPERPCDSLRGIVWVTASGEVQRPEWGDIDDIEESWSDVDRTMIPYNPHAGLIERGDCGLSTAVFEREAVEYVIPIRGRQHGMTEPEQWQ